jgi:hypothetical protein
MRDFFISIWTAQSQTVKEFFNSNFISTISGAFIGALFGALFGARAAQHIAERSKIRDELTKEIRITNAAIMVAATICNSLLTLKKQNLRQMKETFDQKKREFLSLQNSQAENRKFEIQFDLETLKLPLLPLPVLQKQLFENLSIGGRPLATMAALEQATDSLSASMVERNQLIMQYQTAGQTGPAFIPIYFGLRQSNGVTDQRYAATLDAIYAYANDGIFFSNLLSRDLTAYGKRLAEKYQNSTGEDAPKISEINQANAEQASLMPNKDEYASWLSGFVLYPNNSAPQRRWWNSAVTQKSLHVLYGLFVTYIFVGVAHSIWFSLFISRSACAAATNGMIYVFCNAGIGISHFVAVVGWPWYWL